MFFSVNKRLKQILSNQNMVSQACEERPTGPFSCFDLNAWRILYTLHLSAQVSPDMCGAKVNTLVSVPGVLTASVLYEAEVWKVRKTNFGSQPGA